MEMQNFAKIDFLLNITAPETTRKRQRTLPNRALLDLMVRERIQQTGKIWTEFERRPTWVGSCTSTEKTDKQRVWTLLKRVMVSSPHYRGSMVETVKSSFQRIIKTKLNSLKMLQRGNPPPLTEEQNSSRVDLVYSLLRC